MKASDRSKRAAGAVVVVCCLLFASVASAQNPWTLDFSLESDFAYRTIYGGLFDGDTQSSLYENLYFYGARHWGGRDMTLLVSGRYMKDFDEIDSDSILYGITDTYSSASRFEPQQIYLAVDSIFNMEVAGVKLGRQFYYGAEPVRFDGAFAYLQDPGGKYLKIYGYAGALVSYFEDETIDEAPWGAGVEILFLPENTTYIEVFRLFDYVMSVGLRQEIASTSRVVAEYRSINGYPMDARAEAQLWSYRYDALVSLFYNGALGPRDLEGYDQLLYDYMSSDNNKPDYYKYDEPYYYQEYRVEHLNFTPLMPYWELGLAVEKGFFGGKLRPAIEYAVHRLSDEDDEDYYNFSYDRARAWVNLSGLPMDEFSLSVGFELTEDMREKSGEKIDSNAIWARVSAGALDRKLVGEAGVAARTYSYKGDEWTGDEYSLAIRYNPCDYSSLEVEFNSLSNDWYEELVGTSRIDTITASLEVRY